MMNQDQAITVTLLGTGNPPPVMHRFGPSTLVEAGAQTFLFDAGRGALQRLYQLQVGWRDVQGVFLTHLHSDHVVGFPDLWLTGWLVGRRDAPLLVWGPRGTQKTMAHLEQAFEYDIRIRLYDDRAAPDGVVILAEDITAGVVYEQGGVTITAFEVDHTPSTRPSATGSTRRGTQSCSPATPVCPTISSGPPEASTCWSMKAQQEGTCDQT
jgi:ribonuclease Z